MSNIDLDRYFGRKVSYSRDNLPRIKEAFYVISMDDTKGPGTHWVSVFNKVKDCLYFDSYGVSPPEEIIGFMKMANKDILYNIYRIQSFTSVLCGYYCIDFITSMLNGIRYIDWLIQYDPKYFQNNNEKVLRNLKL